MSKPIKIISNGYRYDPLDRLISDNSTQLFYNGDRIATELNSSKAIVFFCHERTPLAEIPIGSEATLHALDLKSSILKSISAFESQAWSYTPYGYRVAVSCGGITGLLGFNGERADLVTGHYLLGQGYRAYNPVLMRFNSPDNLSPFGKGSINSYSFCEDDPVNNADPDAHFSQFWRVIRDAIASKRIFNTVARTRAVASPEAATPLGLFSKVEGAPHVTETILSHLDGRDLASFSATSKVLKKTVDEFVTPAQTLFADKGHERLLTVFENAAKGNVTGILPRDAIVGVTHLKVMQGIRARRKIKIFKSVQHVIPGQDHAGQSSLARRKAFSIRMDD